MNRRPAKMVMVVIAFWILVAGSGCAWTRLAMRKPTPTPTFTKTPRPPTATLTATPTTTPTSTPTPLPTDTSTPTLSPTPLPTDTPLATNTPRPLPPTNTPTPPLPTDTSTPDVDFRVIEQRMLSKEENGGCVGKQNIFVTVIDANDNPLNGIVVGDIYGNTEAITGDGKPPGQTDLALWGNEMWIIVKRGPDQEYTSEITRKLTSRKPEVSDLMAGGYCPGLSEERCLEERELNHLCFGHYSYNVIFQRQW